ncbi:MAG: hypothetical protein JW861_07830 [Bacteroidales bacterium]|nr:hypothetical protein [Bacteroidales bacterium]
MKSATFLTALLVILMAGCSTTYQTADFDDVYRKTSHESETPAKAKSVYQAETAEPDYYQSAGPDESTNVSEDYQTGDYVEYQEEEPYYSTSESYADPNGTTYITNNYYYDGYASDYYDYSYSARIRRFHDPYFGFGYYSPCYTNAYWYNYDPWYWGSSIYFGYPFWSPSLYFGFSYNWGWGGFGMGWGWPNYYGGYYPWYGYSPWYGYGSYWHGYWDGYYASQYFNSWDYYSSYYYYGHRPARGGGNNPGPGGSGNYSTFGEKYENAAALGRGVRGGSNTGTGTMVTGRPEQAPSTEMNNVSVRSRDNQTGNERYQVTGEVKKPVANESQSLERQGAQERVTTRQEPVSTERQPRYTYRTTQSGETQGGERYVPGNDLNVKRTQENGTHQPSSRPVKTYQAPENTRTTERQSTPPQNNRTNVQQGRDVTPYNPPANRESRDVFSRPSQNQRNNYTPPARNTYTPPSRSTKSYSPPARSSGSNSFSSPSRSSSRSYTPSGSSGRSSNSSPRSSSSSGSSSGRSRK